MNGRLPRRVRLGRGYVVEVVLAPQATLRDVCEVDEEHLDGAWDSQLGEDGLTGRIYVYEKLSLGKKWETYWHELVHAVNDIMAWDREHPLKT